MSRNAKSHPGMWLLLWSLTLMRVALLPVFFLLAAGAQEVTRSGLDPDLQRILLGAVLLTMGLTDVGDGWVARRYDLSTQAGALVDALADKLVQVTLAAYFALVDGPAFTSLPVWFLGLVVGRDLLLGAGWLSFRVRRIPVHVVHRLHGKSSSVGVFLVFFALVAGIPGSALPVALVPVSLLIVASTIAYLRDGWSQLEGSRDPAVRSR